jgi:hypothetical protein
VDSKKKKKLEISIDQDEEEQNNELFFFDSMEVPVVAKEKDLKEFLRKAPGEKSEGKTRPTAGPIESRRIFVPL